MRTPQLFPFRAKSRAGLSWYLTVATGWPLIGIALVELVTAQRVAWVAAFAMTATLGILLELLPLLQGRGHDPQGVVMSTAFMCALMFVWGPWPAIVMLVVGSILSDLRAGKAIWKLAFNSAQYTLSIGAAALVCVVLGGNRTLDAPLSRFHMSDLIWMATAWVVYFVVNIGLVGLVVAPDRVISFLRVDLRNDVLMTFAVLALSPLVVVVGLGTWELMPLLLIPLLLLYSTAQIALAREHEAGHDALTGLPNRSTLQFELASALADYERDGQGFALMLIDLNDFKRVNDTLGHQIGDGLLVEFARRLSASLRPHDSIARLGGDEFAILVRDVDSATVSAVGERIVCSVADAFTVESVCLEVNLSLGIALCPDHGTDAVTLLSRADIAMYLAKQQGSGMEIYSVETDDNSAVRLGLVGELRQALAQDDIELHFQPKVDTISGRPIGLEALVRWRHPVRGYIPPDEFIPLAERTGVMPLLTGRVLALAIAFGARLRDEGMSIPIAVNVSPTDLAGGVLVDLVGAPLRAHDLDPSLLLLEITERLSTQQVEKTRSTLDQLRANGVRISLDDFGTGYSSLARLSTLPVDEIKIDRLFIARLADHPTAVGIVQAIIDLAHALGLPAIAEGIETEAEWNAMRLAGCDAVQGWAIARPLPADESIAWLAATLDETGGRPGVFDATAPYEPARADEPDPARGVVAGSEIGATAQPASGASRPVAGSKGAVEPDGPDGEAGSEHYASLLV